MHDAWMINEEAAQQMRDQAHFEGTKNEFDAYMNDAFAQATRMSFQHWLDARKARVTIADDKQGAGMVYGPIKTVFDKPPNDGKFSNPKDSIGDTKVPLWLLSPIAKAHWALGQYAGMLKYGAWNWRKAGVRSSVYLSAIERHLEAYKSGEELDPVDGSHHLGNIMACCAILLDSKAANMLTDDRPPSVSVRDTFQFVEHTMAKLKQTYKDKDPKHYTIKDV